MYTVTPKETYAEVLTCISAGLVPIITSSPGVGKSSVVAQIAKTYRLKLIDVRLSQCTPEDLQGFPMRNGDKATFTPFDLFPLKGEDIPEGFDGWLLFLDEATSASKPVQAASYKLVLDRMVGSFHLHPNVAIVMAGNKATDKAVVTQMSTALQSRLIHYEMDVSSTEWLDYAIENEFDHRITGFISYMPGKLMDFRPDHQDKTFPCPRTWEFLSRLIKNKPVGPEIGARVAGTIGQGVGVEFITFAQEFDKLPKLRDIVSDPTGTDVPTEASTKYAAMSMLIANFETDTLDPILEYVDRFPIEIQVIFVRGVVARSPELRYEHNKLGDYLLKMVRYLKD